VNIALIASAWRLIASIAGLLIFSAWEIKQPSHKLAENRLRHYLRNISLGITNTLIMQIVMTSGVVAYYNFLTERNFGILNLLRLPSLANVVLSLIFLDFITYIWHRAYHEVPLLWRLHKVHHTDLDLDVTSASRFHVGEIIVSTVFKMAIGFLWGPGAFALALHETFLFAAAQFHHSNIKLPEPWESRLRAVIVTPDIHHIHHSSINTQTDSNYSNLFSIWDRLLGSYTSPANVSQETIVYGLKSYPDFKDVTLPKLLAMPFIN